MVKEVKLILKKKATLEVSFEKIPKQTPKKAESCTAHYLIKRLNGTMDASKRIPMGLSFFIYQNKSRATYRLGIESSRTLYICSCPFP